MKTKQQLVTQEMFVWAIPKNPAYADMSDGELFTYELWVGGDHHWRSDSICVHKAEVGIELPEGIDLIHQAFATLEAKKDAALTKYNDEIRKIDEQISQMRLLAGPSAEPGNIY